MSTSTDNSKCTMCISGTIKMGIISSPCSRCEFRSDTRLKMQVSVSSQKLKLRNRDGTLIPSPLENESLPASRENMEFIPSDYSSFNDSLENKLPHAEIGLDQCRIDVVKSFIDSNAGTYADECEIKDDKNPHRVVCTEYNSSNSMDSQIAITSHSKKRERDTTLCSDSIENLSSVQFIETCIICSISLSTFTLLARELHINSCLDNMATNKILEHLKPCAVCGVDLSGLNAQDQEFHTNECLDATIRADALMRRQSELNKKAKKAPTKYVKLAELPVTTEAETMLERTGSSNIRCKNNYACRICGLKINAKSLSERLVHTKKCGAENNIEPRDLNETNILPRAPILLKQQRIDKFFGISVRSVSEVLMSSSSSNFTYSSNNTVKQPENPKKTYITNLNKRSAKFVKCPAYKKIVVQTKEGKNVPMPIIVDGFKYACKELSSVYILTHMHSDHYGGITRNWNYGVIYATASTARLVHENLKVESKYLHVLSMNEPTTIFVDGTPVVITMLDANHCPGSACALLEMENGFLCLHVGDFRWDRDTMLKLNPVLKSLGHGLWANLGSSAGDNVVIDKAENPSNTSRRLDSLYLDTTYCNPKYTFPCQKKVINATKVAIEKHIEGSKDRNSLVLFGAYSLGKERLYLEVARQFGKQIYVDKSRYRTLSCFGWPASTMQLLTTDPAMTNFWVVPISHINFTMMRTYGRRKVLQSEYEQIIGIRPTGWTFNSTKKSENLLSSTQQGPDFIYGAPYSEHSSFPELLDCVRYLNPRRIVPTVNCSTHEKVQQQLALLSEARKQTKLS